MRDLSRLFGGTFLIAGTSIGAGMLALPVLTGLGGFVPSFFVYFSCWLFMSLTGLLFLEICLSLKEGANIITMVRETLGKKAVVVAVFLYIFLFYFLILAYIVGGGQFFFSLFDGTLSHSMCSFIFVLFLAPFVCSGAKAVGHLNNVMMLGLVVSYVIFVLFGYSFVKTEYLKSCNWTYALLAMPVAFTAFGYQGTVPSLIRYMNRDYRKIRFAIVVGSFIPLVIYVIWEWLILGIVPIGEPEGIIDTLKKGQSAIYPLQYYLGNPWLFAVSQAFAFFALVTSFLGVSLGMKDFFADGLSRYHWKYEKPFLWGIVFIPPFLGSCFNSHIFLTALNYAGGIGCATLLGLFPILMAWKLRYQKKMKSDYRLWGGKLLLVILLIFVVLELGLELAQEMGWGLTLPESESQVYSSM